LTKTVSQISLPEDPTLLEKEATKFWNLYKDLVDIDNEDDEEPKGCCQSWFGWI